MTLWLDWNKRSKSQPDIETDASTRCESSLATLLTAQRQGHADLGGRQWHDVKIKGHRVEKNIHEDVREYLLLGLYAGTALRLPSPATHLLVLFWMEKAHPLCTAHVVPVHKSPLEIYNNANNPPQKADLPFCTNHGAESFGAFERVGKVHPAAVFARQLWFLLFFWWKSGVEKSDVKTNRTKPKIRQHRCLVWKTHWHVCSYSGKNKNWNHLEYRFRK